MPLVDGTDLSDKLATIPLGIRRGVGAALRIRQLLDNAPSGVEISVDSGQPALTQALTPEYVEVTLPAKDTEG